MNEIIAIAVVFFLIMDPLGNTPLFLTVLKQVDPNRHNKIILRELAIAHISLMVYLFAGQYIMDFLGLSSAAISISGGIILFIIALKMIFQSGQGVFGDSAGDEPMIVPLAIPAVAGPLSACCTDVNDPSPFADDVDYRPQRCMVDRITDSSLCASTISRIRSPCLSAVERLMV